MQLMLTGRHIEMTEAMRHFAEEKLRRLDRYYDRVENVDVILDHAPPQFRIEVVVRADHKHTFVAQVDAPDYYEAIDLVVDKLGRQLTRHKEKYRNRKHPDTGAGERAVVGGA